MKALNFPPFSFRIETKAGKDYIWDEVRGKWYMLTPEEWVRQHSVQYLHQVLKQPLGRMGLEVILDKNRPKRSDIVVYDSDFKPHILVECKRPSLAITQQSFDQIARYNLQLQADYLMVTNGLSHYYARINTVEKRYDFLKALPAYRV